MTVRSLAPRDRDACRAVVQATELFHPERLDAMFAAALDGSGAHAPFCCVAGAPVHGLAYADHETLTEGTWNLRLIAVHPAQQGAGLGRALVGGIETAVAARGGMRRVIDTASTPDFAGARAFYARLGYKAVASVPDFWGAGADKITFLGRLAPVPSLDKAGAGE